ncbi:MAG TPA: YciI family protein [Verrucomicrobiales bacterium]|nr:YciI family protein [Verrucomicrobiales bacterium]
MIPAGYRDNKQGDFTPDRKDLEKMGKFNEELGKVFEITDLNGLRPLTVGARVNFKEGKATVTDGPFIETREVLGGYWLIEAPSKEELVKWAQKCPAEDGDIIEIRQIFEFEEE